MSDLPYEGLNHQTPLDLAYKPHMDRLAAHGQLYSVKNVPDGMPPGSDTANMSAMGINPAKYYSGRSPLEAVSMGIDLAEDDLSFRVNLVTLSGESELADCTMIDYSSGEITSEESGRLIAALKPALDTEAHELFAGKSYRHCLVWHGGRPHNALTPPHDITNRPVRTFLPEGPGKELFRQLMEKSREILADHPVNLKRRERGLRTADCLWPWGEGTRPKLPNLYERYGVHGTVISAVDLVQGIGICLGMNVMHVKGATGNLQSDFAGKGKAAIAALLGGSDYVYLHVEAPDECGHQGDAAGKVKAIELIDEHIVGPVVAALEKHRRETGEPYRVMVMPDHPTPLATQTHSADPVPCVLFDSESRQSPTDCIYNEICCQAATAAAGGRMPKGYQLFAHFIDPNVDPFADDATDQ